MPKTKFIISIIVAIMIVAAQVGTVFAAPDRQAPTPIVGTVLSITLETNTSTGITTVIVTFVENQETVRVSLETARKKLGLVVLDGNGTAIINDEALEKWIEIDPKTVIPDEEEMQHPVASALALFFSDILGIDYETIMASHEEGFGFGVIAQALWLTKELDGDSEIFAAILEARSTGDYSVFILPDGTTPKNWGQLRKAILNGEQGNPGSVISGQNHEHGNSNNNGHGHGNDKPKKDHKENNGNNGNH